MGLKSPPKWKLGELANDNPTLFERRLCERFFRFDIPKTIGEVEHLYLRRLYLVHPKYPRTLLEEEEVFDLLRELPFDYDERAVRSFWDEAKHRLVSPNLYLHHILLPDQDRNLHDHPADFGAFILNGGYIEKMPGSVVYREKGKGRFQDADQLHSIDYVLPGTWTLFARGDKTRIWGFQTPNGWVDFRTYLKEGDKTPES